MLERMRRIDERRDRLSSFSRKKASLTTVVTVEERGEGEIKVLERLWPALVLDSPEPTLEAVGRSGWRPGGIEESLSGVIGLGVAGVSWPLSTLR